MKKPALPNIDFKELLEDFRGLNPNDVGSWPVAPRVAVLVALFIALLGAGWWFVWQDQIDALDGKHNEEVKLK